MLVQLINRYFRTSRNHTTTTTTTTTPTPAAADDMPASASASNEAAAATAADRDYLCLSGCVPVRAKRTTTTTTTTTARTSRHNFVRAAASGLLSGASSFTNHESLPPLPDAHAEFVAAFPQYDALAAADAIRAAEYPHLHTHVCLDYSGINLFSHSQMNPSSSSSLPSTSSSSAPPPPPSSTWQPPFFDISYKSTSLRTQLQQRSTTTNTNIGAAVTRRIMASLKIPGDEYAMVCTANRTTAFRLLAESYSFHSSSGSGGKNLLPVYDYESEAVRAMSDAARRRGATVTNASFAWPSFRIHGADLRKRLSSCSSRKRRNRRGLFVFPLASRMTGARYPYLWMSAAQEHGWHVALDACAMGTKDLDTFGVSLIRPDFIVCNFFKVFGENPSGFAALFVKRTSMEVLERSVIARSIGVVTIVPARRWSLHDGGYSTEFEHSRSFTNVAADDVDVDVETTSSFSGPLSSTAAIANRTRTLQSDTEEIREVDCTAAENGGGFYYSEEPEPEHGVAENGHEAEQPAAKEEEESVMEELVVECRGLDHADALGLIAIGNRLRYISNWLVVALQKLRHPHAGSNTGHQTQLVRLYGPRVKFERGPSVAFNVFDWKGERVAPLLVQKLADRHGISLTCGFLRNIWFADKYEAEKAAVLEHRVLGVDAAGEYSVAGAAVGGTGKKRKDAAGDVGILVVNASLGFLSNFEDAYRLWAFVAKFLDADFVEKERWRYTALNQKTVEV